MHNSISESSAKKFGAVLKSARIYIPSCMLFLFIAWIIVVADLDKDNLFFKLAHDIKHGDKMAHFGLYGLLAYFVNRATRFKSFNLQNYKILFGSAMVLTFAIAEEFTQLAFANRTFDWFDMLSDFVGIWGVTYLLSRKHGIRTK